MLSAVVPSEDALFLKGLNQLLKGSKYSSVDHGYDYFQYHIHRLSELYDVRNSSFIVINNKVPIAAFVGMVSNNIENLDLPCILLLPSTRVITKKEKKFFLNKLEEKLSVNEMTLAFRDYLHGGKLSFLSKYLLKKGYSAQPSFNQVIDLSVTEEEIKKNLRKSYKSLICKPFYGFDIMVYDSACISWSVFQEVQGLHFEVVGKKSRSDEVWRHQYELINKGTAFIVTGYLDDEIVSAGYFGYNATNCIYQMSVSKRDMFDRPIFHSLMMKAIFHARSMGCQWFEVGEQVFKNHPVHRLPTDKEIGISLFKAGFGGETRVYMDVKPVYE